MKYIPINQLFQIIGGNPAPKGDDAFSTSGLPFVKMRDLGKAHFSNNLTEFENRISDRKATELKLKVINKGSILIPRSGSVALNHRAILGTDAYMVSHICALEVIDNKVVNNTYAYYYLRTISMDRITKKTTGLDAITFADLGKINIPIPPLHDQICIATILTRAESLIAKRKESIKAMDELLKSTFLEMFGDPVGNEKGWEKKRIDEIADSRLGKMRDRQFITGKHLKYYLGNSNVRWFSFDFDTLEQMDFDENEQVKFSLQYGDLLICEGGEIGRCAIWKCEKENVYFQKALHRVRVYKEIVFQEYLAYVFYLYSLGNGFKNVTNKATIAHLTGEKLKETLVPIPSLPLQSQFVSIFKKIEALKERYTQNIIELEHLYNSISQRAFKGELDLSKVQVETKKEIIELHEGEKEISSVNSKPTEYKIYTEAELIKTIKSLADETFSLDSLMTALEKAAFKEMPQYGEIKEQVYKMLEGAHPLLLQIFDKVKKEIVLKVNI